MAVDFVSLPKLLRRVAAIVHHGGIGTTIQALAAGVPSVLLDTPVARETAGAAASYVSPAAGRDLIAAALVSALTDDNARRGLLAHAPAVLARYDWKSTADQTLAAIEGAAVGR